MFAPLGGFQKVSQAFENLSLKCGANVLYGKTVMKITQQGVYYLDNDKVEGGSSSKELDEEFKGEEKNDGVGSNPRKCFLPADLVVINADLPYATKSLLFSPDDVEKVDANNEGSHGIDDKSNDDSYLPRYDWDDSFDYSPGVISFHWSVTGRTCDSLATHNVFLSASSRSNAIRSWDILGCFDKGKRGTFEDESSGGGPPLDRAGPFNFYVHRPTATDPTAAPIGCDSITVLVPCRTLSKIVGGPKSVNCDASREEMISSYRKQFDNDAICRAKETVLERMSVVDGLKNLKGDIIDEVVDTPADYADFYNVAAGTPFALVRVYYTIFLFQSYLC